MGSRFFCSNCSHQVSLTDVVCPACNTPLTAVMCPSCRYVGMPLEFQGGCPQCGHGGRSASARARKDGSHSGSGHSPWLAWTLVGVIVLFSILLFLFLRLMSS